MIYQQTNASKTTEVLNDLIRINNERIAMYQTALNQSNIDTNLRDTFYQIVSEGQRYRHDLMLKINELEGNVTNGVNILGKIYTAWVALKVAFSISTQKAIIASCMYNEEIALHAYKSALSNDGMPGDVFQMICEHEKGLSENYNLLRSCRNSRQAASASLMYFA